MSELLKQTQTQTQLFNNPWKLAGEYNKDKHSRIQVDLPKEEFAFFKGINPTSGVMQTTINILLKQLQYELRQQGITTVTQCREFCEAVAGVRVVLGASIIGGNGSTAGSTTIRPMPEASASNDGRREKKTPSKDKKLKK